MEPEPQETKRTLSLGTYNFFIRPPGIGKNEFKDFRCKSLASFLHDCGINNDSLKLADLDILCLQEVFSTYYSSRQK